MCYDGTYICSSHFSVRCISILGTSTESNKWLSHPKIPDKAHWFNQILLLYSQFWNYTKHQPHNILVIKLEMKWLKHRQWEWCLFNRMQLPTELAIAKVIWFTAEAKLIILFFLLAASIFKYIPIQKSTNTIHTYVYILIVSRSQRLRLGYER